MPERRLPDRPTLRSGLYLITPDDPDGERLLARTLPDAERTAFERRLRDLVEAHHSGGRVAFPAAAWLVSAVSDYRNG